MDMCVALNQRAQCGPHPPGVVPVPDDGRRHLGRLEEVLHRQWAAGTRPSAAVIGIIDALARLPRHIADRVVEEVDAIYVGEGSVVDLQGMGHLRGQHTDPRNPRTLLWDEVPGIYSRGVMALGSVPHAGVSLVLHEVGHVLDIADRLMSETREWRDLHRACRPLLRRRILAEYRGEWWAEAFALAASHMLGPMVRLLGGERRLAYRVTEYFQTYYGVVR
ncbi:MAG: hypothetical protein M0026_09065 [Nocardiopsaceae bacterium]|nr:hypothetical protein [Nocardiopsaceae bacterium]